MRLHRAEAIRFDYLRPEQATTLFERHCVRLGWAIETKHQTAIGNLTNLTPGDFAAVMRQHRFRPLAGIADFIAALQAECAVKEGVQGSMGFL